jgi:hypothetical protein
MPWAVDDNSRHRNDTKTKEKSDTNEHRLILSAILHGGGMPSHNTIDLDCRNLSIVSLIMAVLTIKYDYRENQANKNGRSDPPTM